MTYVRTCNTILAAGIVYAVLSLNGWLDIIYMLLGAFPRMSQLALAVLSSVSIITAVLLLTILAANRLGYRAGPPAEHIEAFMLGCAVAFGCLLHTFYISLGRPVANIYLAMLIYFSVVVPLLWVLIPGLGHFWKQGPKRHDGLGTCAWVIIMAVLVILPFIIGDHLSQPPEVKVVRKPIIGMASSPNQLQTVIEALQERLSWYDVGEGYKAHWLFGLSAGLMLFFAIRGSCLRAHAPAILTYLATMVIWGLGTPRTLEYLVYAEGKLWAFFLVLWAATPVLCTIGGLIAIASYLFLKPP
jgi:hypothetical protein